MASWTQRTFLIALLLPGAMPIHAAEPARDISAGEEAVLDPRIERRRVKEAQIDAENFEIGAYTGLLSIENFEVSSLSGARFAYHVSEDVFLEAAVGLSRAGKTSFEELNPGVDLIDDDDRDLMTWHFDVAYQLLPGEAFLTSERAYNDAFYLIGGAGNTEFAGDSHFTLNLGVGYRLLLTDWVTMRVEMRDHLFELDVFGDDEVTHNLAWTIGLGGFF